MIALWVFVAISIAVLAAFVLLPLRLHVMMQAEGDPRGHWAVAGGARVGPLSLTAAAAPQIQPVLQLHLFRWRLLRRELMSAEPPKADEVDEVDEPPTSTLTLSERYAQLERWFDPQELAAFIAGEHKRFHLDHLDVELGYGFRDIALTGKIFAGLCVLSGLLPRRVSLHQKPSWEFADRATADVSGRVTIWPGRLAVDAVTYAAKNVRLRKPAKIQASELELEGPSDGQQAE